MKTHSKRLIKQFAAAALSLTVAVSAFGGNSVLPTYADTIEAFDEQTAATGGEIDSTQGGLSELEQRQKELDKLIKATEGDISSEKEHKQALNEQITVVEDTLHALAGSVTDLRDAIAATEAEITAKEAEVEQKKKEIDKGIEEYKQRLRVMYIAGEQNSYTEILVGASDFYDMLMKMELIKRVAAHDSGELDGLVAMKAQYEKDAESLNQQKEQLEEDLAQLKQRRKQQKAQMQKLENLYSETEATLDQLAYDKEVYEANKEQIQKEHEQFEADLQALFEKQQAIAQAKADEQARLDKLKQEQKTVYIETQKKNAEKTENKKKKTEETAGQTDNNGGEDYQPDYVGPKEIEGDEDPFRDEPQNQDDGNENDGGENGGDYSDGGNGQTGGNDNTPAANSDGSDPNDAYGYTPKSRFTWPVPGFYHISYGVGYRWGAYHQGIDIWSEGIRGHNIIAADSGTVILVSNTCPHDYGKNGSCGCGGGYGNYCIIDHGDGWWTLYGHSEGITVSEGQWVNKGDVLGTVGSTGYSTGPHLHFEVRINNEPQNPEDYV